MKIGKEQKQISLKEAARISGYSSDYIGWLIRKKRIKGEKVYTNTTWQVLASEIIKYCKKKKNLGVRDSFWLKKKYLSLKKAAELSGYAPDYIGYLIRKREIAGKRVHSSMSWLTTEDAIRKYQGKFKDQKLKKRKINQGIKLVYDIFPPERVREVAREITGWKPYKNKLAKVFAVSLRFALATFVLLLLVGIGPVEIFQKVVGAFAKEEKTINFYPTVCSGGWENPQNTQGKPELSEGADASEFKEGNSAVLKDATSQIFCGGFEGEVPKDAEPKKVLLKFSWTIKNENLKTRILDLEELEETPIDISPEPSPETPPPEGISPKEIPPAEGNEILEPPTEESSENNQPEQNQQPNPEPNTENLPSSEPESNSEPLPPTSFWKKIISFAFAQEDNQNIPEETTLGESNEEKIETNSENSQTNFEEEQISEGDETPTNEENEAQSEPEEPVPQEPEEESTVPSPVSTPIENMVSDAFLEILYTLDSINWQSLGKVNNNNWRNLTLEVPISGWEDLEKIQISIQNLMVFDDQPTVYLDGLWLGVDYQEKEEEDFELVALKKDWRADETPTFEVIPRKEESIIESLVSQISSVFEAKPKVQADLVRPNNEILSLQEGENFTTETHSPTKITIFKPEDFRPGLYKLNIDYERSGKVYNLEENFTWGVLAINVNKSIYLPNEQAFLQIGALNEEGHTICDADLTLEITAPDGTKTIFTTAGEPIQLQQQEEEVQEEVQEEIQEEVQEETQEEVIEEEQEVEAETNEESIQQEEIQQEEQPEEEEAGEEEVPQEEGQQEEQQQEEQEPQQEEEADEEDQTQEQEQGLDIQEQQNQEEQGSEEISLWNKVKTFFSGLVNKRGEKLAYLRLGIKRFTASVVKAEEWTTSTPDITTSTDEGEEVMETGETVEGEQQEEQEQEEQEQEEQEQEEQEQEEQAGEQEEDIQQQEQQEEQEEPPKEETQQEEEIKDEGQQPGNETIIYRSSECGPNSVTYTPDYYTYYIVGEPGEYQLKLTAITKNGAHEIEDSFEVRDSVPFDVERIGPTRIYPPATYEMTIKIKVNQDFTGQVNETLPESFQILECQSCLTENSSPLTKKLGWEVEWKAGESYELKYQFDAPDISPYLYLLGPLKFEGKTLIDRMVDKVKEGINFLFGEIDQNHAKPDFSAPNEADFDLFEKVNVTFQEARQWQIAGDSPAAPVIESSTNIAELATTAFNVALPSETAAGDLLVAIIAKDDDIAMDSSHGFTDAFVGGIVGVDHSTWCWYKIADADDVTRTYVTFTGDKEDYVGRMYRITGHNPDNPIYAVDTTGATGTSATPQAPAIVTVIDTLVFAVTGMDDNDVPYAITTGGWTEDLNTSVTTAGIVIARKAFSAAGSTGAVDFTTNASDGWAASQVAINGNFPPTVALNTPLHEAEISDTTPTFEFTGTDLNSDDIRYNIQVDTVNTFDSQGSYPVVYFDPGSREGSSSLYLGGTKQAGEAFKSSGGKLTSCKFIMDKIGLPTGNAVAYLYAVTGTYGVDAFPTGSPLAVSENFDVSVLTGTPTLIEFTFSGAQQYQMSVDTIYAIGLWFQGGESGNHIRLYLNVSVPYEGNRWYQGATDTYYGYSTDAIFYVYSSDVAPLLNKVSGTDDGFVNPDVPEDTDPFTSGENIQYTVQVGEELSAGTYYWRVRGLDPLGTNTYGAWSSPTWSFTITTVISISGTSDMSSGTINWAKNGVSQSGSGTISGGTWTISEVDITTDDIIVVWVEGAEEADESTGVAKYSGSGDLSGMVLNRHVLSVGGVGNQSLIITDVGSYTNSSNENVMQGFSGSTLTVDGGNSYSDEEIDILTTDTLTVGSSEILTTFHLTITGTLTSTTTATYNVAGNWTNNGTFNQGSSTVTLNGSSAQNISGSTTTTFNNLTVSGTVTASVTFNVDGTLSVSGTFTPSGGTVMMNNNSSISNSGALTFQDLSIAASATVTTTASFNIAGTLTVNASGNFSPGVGSTIMMTGTSWAISNSATLVFKGLTIDGTPTTQPTNDFSVSGALTVNSGKTLAPTDGTITMTGGSIVNNGGSTSNLVFTNLTVTGTTSTSSDFTINKTLNVSGGNLTSSGGTITMVTTSWAITNSGTLVFSGLTISETPSVSGQPTSSFNIGGTLTINSGKNLASTAGTITMTGTSWGITNSGSLTFYNWTIDGTASPQPTASFSVANTLTVNSGKNLSPTAGTITMTGGSIVNSGGTLTFYNLIVSGSTSTTSTFGISNDLTVNGTLTVGSGTGVITANGNVTGSGTMTLTAGTFQQVVATDKNFGSSSNANNWTFNNLKFNNSDEVTGHAITPNAGTGQIIVGGTLTLGDSGTQTITFDNETSNDRIFDLNGDFTIASQGIFSASSTQDLNIAGSYANSGTFTANSGTVTLDGSGLQTLSGTMTTGSSFYDLTIENSSGSVDGCSNSFSPGIQFSASATISNNYTIATSGLSAGVYVQYNSGSTYTCTNISWEGTDTKKIYFRNSILTSGTWLLYVSGTQGDGVSYVDVARSDAFGGDGGAEIDADDGTNVDCGNNLNWNFYLPSISYQFSTNSLNLGNINPTNVASNNHTLTVTTNAPGGYILYISEDGELRKGSDEIDDVTDGSVTAGFKEYGLNTGYGDFTNDAAITDTMKIVREKNSPASGEVTTCTYKAAVDNLTPQGYYSHIVTIVVTGRF